MRNTAPGLLAGMVPALVAAAVLMQTSPVPVDGGTAPAPSGKFAPPAGKAPAAKTPAPPTKPAPGANPAPTDPPARKPGIPLAVEPLAPLPDKPTDVQFAAALDDAVARAVAYLFSLQSDKLLLVVGTDAHELDAKWEDLRIDARSRTATVKGRVFTDVRLAMPPGWFGPYRDGEGEDQCAGKYQAGGHSALITVALLAARVNPDKDPRMAAAIDSLLNLWVPMPDGLPLQQGPAGTYAIGLRLSVIEAALRAGKDKARRDAMLKAARRDLAALVGGWTKTGYTYMPTTLRRPPRNDEYSMSRTQYGMLGLWSAEMIPELEVPANAWDHLRILIVESQNPDGGWAYIPAARASTPTMTSAGVTGLAVMLDQMHTRTRGPTAPVITAGMRTVSLVARTLDRGLDNLGRTFQPDGGGYYNYGIERAATACGYKYFGGKDWYRIGAENILRARSADGQLAGTPGRALGMSSIGSTPIRETAWNLLFLVHGGAPVLVNKLRWGKAGDLSWANYPRDAAGLARRHHRDFEEEVNWQVVSLAEGTAEDLLDAPFLYVSGYKALDLSAPEVARLAAYLARGGTALFVPVGPATATKPFVDSVGKLVDRLRPEGAGDEWRLTPVPFDHPVRNVPDEKTRKLLDRFELKHVDNGHRSVIFLAGQDLAWAWPADKGDDRTGAFHQFHNLRRYVTDRGPLPRKFRPRPEDLLATAAPAAGTVRIGVLRTEGAAVLRVAEGKAATDIRDVPVTGDWACAPAGWETAAPWLLKATGLRIEVERAIDAGTTDLAKYDLLHVAGSREFALTEPARAAVARFLAGGGTILFEQVGGGDQRASGAFHKAAMSEARRLADGVDLGPPATNDALLTGEGRAGFAVGKVPYSRAYVLGPAGGATEGPPVLSIGKREGRTAVIVSPLDLSCALAGIAFEGRRGYTPTATRELAVNLLTGVRRRDVPVPAMPTSPAPAPDPKTPTAPATPTADPKAAPSPMPKADPKPAPVRPPL